MAAAPPPPPPPGGSAAAGDIDLLAVENIPRETLVALLKRKDKEAKGLAAKLEKLEERYVKVVRFNKILMEDRSSFQRFCGQLLPESDGQFEEAAAQETPVNLEALLRRLNTWRGAMEGASEDRKIFRQFTELVFPGDTAVEQLFNGHALGPEAFDTLQERWTAAEDLHNQSIASVNAMAREQMMVRVGEIEAARNAQREAERKVDELREELTKLHREKAQMLAQRFHGGQGDAKESDSVSASNTGSGASPSPTTVGPSSWGGGQQARELREALDASERRERETREAALRREQDLQHSLDAQRAETQRLKREIERLAEDSERKRAQTMHLVEEKEAAAARLRARLGELEKEADGSAFIAQMAEQQAGRDAEVRAKQKQLDHINQTLDENQRLLQLSYTQERALKERIRELESSHGRGHIAGDYLKHVVLKYMEYTQVGDLKAQGLVPVICTLLKLSPEERRLVEQRGLPQPLLLLNQAVGGASSWFRGSGAESGAAAPALAPTGNLLGAN